MRNRTAAIQDDLQTVTDDVNEMASSAGRDAQTIARDAQDRVVRAFGDAKQRLADVDAQVRNSARQAAEVTDDYVHDRPWQAIAAGALFGLLAGLLLARS